MNAVLKYQYDQIIKQLLLLQDHAAMRFCPYSARGDYCIWKHLLAIEAYADETEPMDDDKSRKEMLETLETEARNHRLEEEAFLNGTKSEGSVLLEDWARKWRKDLEPLSLFASVEKTGGPETDKVPAQTVETKRDKERKIPVGTIKTA